MFFALEEKIQYVEREIEETTARTTAWSGPDVIFGSCDDLLVETLWANSSFEDSIEYTSAFQSFKNRKIRQTLPVEQALLFYNIRRALYHGYIELRDTHDLESALKTTRQMTTPLFSDEVKALIERYITASARSIDKQNPDRSAPQWYANALKELSEMTRTS